MRVVVFLGVLATACAAGQSPGDAAPVRQSVAPAVKSAPARGDGLYPLDAALQDALAGPWEHLGTGPWHGNARAHACAYRNDRVIVVNVYCTSKEPQAFRLDVYSPTRGWVRIYAEAKVPVSTVRRRDYFSFTAEAQPPPRPEAGLPPLALTMSSRRCSGTSAGGTSGFCPPVMAASSSAGRRAAAWVNSGQVPRFL